MPNCELVAFISFLACSIAKDKSPEELALLSAFFVQLRRYVSNNKRNGWMSSFLNLYLTQKEGDRFSGPLCKDWLYGLFGIKLPVSVSLGKLKDFLWAFIESILERIPNQEIIIFALTMNCKNFCFIFINL